MVPKEVRMAKGRKPLSEAEETVRVEVLLPASMKARAEVAVRAWGHASIGAFVRTVLTERLKNS